MSPTIADVYDLTPLQEGMLYHSLREPGSGEYVLQQTFLVEGPLPAGFVRDALDVLAARHDVLRTAFTVPHSSGRARQVVLAQRRPDFHQTDLSDLPPDQRTRALAALRDADVARGFDLERDPLVRVTYVRLGDDRTALIWSLHHIVVDGWSLPIVLGDFLRACTALASGTALPDLLAAAQAQNQAGLRFGQYVRWLRHRDREQALRHWDEALAGHGIPVGIPGMRAAATSTPGVDTASLELPDDVAARLTQLAGAEGSTVSTWCGAAWGLLLQRYNHTDDVMFGTVTSGRDVPLPGVEQLPGLFINTIPTRVRTRAGQSVRDFLHEQQVQALAGAENGFCSLADIQRRAGGDLFSTIVAVENYYVSSQPTPDGLTVSLLGAREQTSYPLGLRIGLTPHLRAEILYDPARYDRPEIAALLHRFATVLTGFTQGLDRPVDAIEETDAAERALLVERFSGADTDGTTGTLGSGLAAAVAAWPDRVALVHGDATMTYAQLGERVDALARTLRARGVVPDRLVAISGQRRFGCIIAILATLRAGGAYLVLDPADPRLAGMLDDSEPVIVLTFGADMDAGGLPSLDLLDPASYQAGGAPLDDVNRPDDLAYCIYTSGTTGKPKGVLIEHHGVVNLARQAARAVGIDPQDRMLKFSNYTFDVSAWEIFVALLNGAGLVIVDEDVMLDSARFLAYTRDTGVTTAVLPPPYFRASLLPGLPKLVTGGSAASPDLVERARGAGAYANGYGPTEITVASHLWRDDPDAPVPHPVPIGHPFPGVTSYVLRGDALCGIGVPGELCIGGLGVARGYLHQPELTAQRFVPNPFGPGRLFRSGDLARWLPGGEVEYLGRMDDQVKVRGFRVELGEVENGIRTLPGVTDAVVVAHPDASGLALHAYVSGPQPLDLAALRHQLRERLPGYMVPALFQQIDTVPLDTAGKPDRHALAPIAPPDRSVTPAGTQAEAAALGVFEDVLDVHPLGVDADFFDNGGDSLKAIQIVARLAGVGLTTSVHEIFSLRTVTAIVAQAQAAPPEQPATQTDAVPTGTVLPPDELDAWCARAQEQLSRYAAQLDADGDAPEQPLLMAQKAMLDLGVLGSCGYVDIPAAWDADRFATAWAGLLDAMPALRAQVRLGAHPAMRAAARTPDAIPFLDLAGLAGAQQAQVLNRLATRIAGPYLDARCCADRFLGTHRVLVARMSPQRFVVLMPVSHLVFDGFSNAVLAHRLTGLYTHPDQPQPQPSRRDDYEAFVRTGPTGVDDEGLVAALDLELFAAQADAWRAHPWSYHDVGVPVDAATPPDAMITLAQALCAAALEYPQPHTPVPYLLVSSARNYAGGNFSDDIGAYLDIVPIVWTPGRPFEPQQRQVLGFVRDHRVNITALLTDDALAERFPRAAGLLRHALPLAHLGMPLVNLLVLYGTQLVTPEPPRPEQDAPGDDRRAFLDVSLHDGQLVLRNIRALPGQEDGLRARLAQIAAEHTRKVTL